MDYGRTQRQIKADCKAWMISLKSLIEAIPELEIIEAGNREIENHCNHALESVEIIEQAMVNNSFSFIEYIFRELAEFQRQVIDELLDYLRFVPVTDERDDAFGLATDINLAVQGLKDDLIELEIFFLILW